jgi:hypothetical protein
MASYTTNLNLKKPAGSENVAIGDINNNMDIIDSAVGTLNSNFSNQSIKYFACGSSNSKVRIKFADANEHRILIFGSTIGNATILAVSYYRGATQATIISSHGTYTVTANGLTDNTLELSVGQYGSGFVIVDNNVTISYAS